MELIVRRNYVYKELRVEEGGTTMTSGLMDDDEARAMVRRLIEAAEELDPDGREFIANADDAA